MQFAAPASGATGATLNDMNGHLLVIEPLDYKADIATSLGSRDAVSAVIHDITSSETHEDFLIFAKVLVGSLKTRIGQRVLGTLTKGQAKPGQQAPWILQDMSSDPGAVNDATRYLTDRTSHTLTTPATDMAATAAAGVELTPELLAALGTITAK